MGKTHSVKTSNTFLIMDMAVMLFLAVSFLAGPESNQWFWYRLGNELALFALLMVLIKSILGIVFFFINIFKKTYSIQNWKNLLLLIPSVFVSIIIIISTLIIILNHLFTWGLIIPNLLSAVGLLLWTSYWFFGRPEVKSIILKTAFGIITPIFFFTTWYAFQAIAGL